MNAPWKVIAAFVGVFIAGAVFGGVFTMRTAGRRAPPPPERALVPVPPGQRLQVAGPQAGGGPVAVGRVSALTPTLMRQFTQRLKLTAEQRERMRPIVSRASEDLQRLRQENLAETARLTERMYEDVAAVLTPVQREELEAMRQQMQERVQAERKRRAEAAAAEAAARAAGAVKPAAAKSGP